MVYAITVTVLLLTVLIRSLFDRKEAPANWFIRRPNQLAGLLLLSVLGGQLSHIRSEEFNVDESTWIANTLAVSQHSNVPLALLTHTTSRPITVLPLLIANKLGLPLDYYVVKLVGTVSVLLTLWLTYLALCHLTTARLAVLAIFPLTTFYTTVQFEDFLAYNSELICNLLLASGLWLYSLLVNQRESMWQVCLAGILLGLMPFAKFQAVPGALVVASSCLYECIHQRRSGRAWLFVSAGLVPSLGAISYCLLTEQISVLVKNYWLYYVYYASEYSPVPLMERFSPRIIVSYYSMQSTFWAYWLGLLLLMIVGLVQSRRIGVCWFPQLGMCILLWLASIYQTLQAGTNYTHYLLLVLVPHTLLAAVLLYPLLNKVMLKPWLLRYGYLLVALICSCFSRSNSYDRGYSPSLYCDAQLVAFIQKISGSTDHLAVWGWADRYYVLSGIAPTGRYANSVFQMKPNSQQEYYLKQYAQDLLLTQPVLFIDAVATNQFVYMDKNHYGHEQFPIIQRIINSDYRLVYDCEGTRVYRLNHE